MSEKLIEDCRHNESCFFTKAGNKVLIVGEDSIAALKQKLKDEERRTQLRTIEKLFQKKYLRKEERYFGRDIHFCDYISAALEQIELILSDDTKCLEDDWEEFFDAQIKLIAIMDVFEDCSKNTFTGCDVEGILSDMENNNYDIGIMRELICQSGYSMDDV
ncbi:hypothetical protein [Clostridium sp. AF32-12BH]|uniref:hypothetical protein n=1 Tax=Clostridium sp. AF32-12BH TaxID=2292006 RepID=UPI0011C2231D|nr:hypothetical protein [Clostridium sp. AF32-12BH]